MAKSPVSIIFDIDGNDAKVANNRLLTDTTVSGVVQVGDNGGSLTVDGTVTADIGLTGGLALETTLSGFRTDFNNEDFATETTLGNIDTTLSSIKGIDGIKKITDALPIGDNIIGRAKITDGTNVVDVVDVLGTKRLQVESVPATGSAATEVVIKDGGGTNALATVDNLTNRLLVQNQQPLPPIVSDFADLVNGFCLNGNSQDLTVDGSGTPAIFQFNPPVGETLALYTITVRHTSNDTKYDNKFGKENALTNGLLFEIKTQGGLVATLVNVKRNEDFALIFERDIDRSNKDSLVYRIGFGGVVKLDQTQGDFVRVTVRDDINKNSHLLLDCFIQTIKVN